MFCGRNLNNRINHLHERSLRIVYNDYESSFLDYEDVLYDQTFSSSLNNRLESLQYNACLAIAAAIRGTLKEKLYQELGLEFLRLWHWYRKLCLFDKTFKKKPASWISFQFNSC